jgi:hypothetical protein
MFLWHREWPGRIHGPGSQVGDPSRGSDKRQGCHVESGGPSKLVNCSWLSLLSC